MEQVKAWSIDAFGELYDRYCDQTYRMAWMVCHDQGRADDALREAFLSLWKGLEGSSSLPAGARHCRCMVVTAVRYRAIAVVRRDTKHAVGVPTSTSSILAPRRGTPPTTS
jgi:DNA-directed RNA polymerase specialized sigma24 family protein